MKRLFVLALLFGICASSIATPKANDPFFPDVEYTNDTLCVTFMMMDAHQHIYDDMLACSLGDPTSKPTARTDEDGRLIYEGLATFTWAHPTVQVFTLEYQGCDAEQCYMPQCVTFTLLPDGNVIEGTVETSQAEQPKAEVKRALSGFVSAFEFLAFLKGSTETTATTDTVSFFKNPRIWVTVHGFWFLIGLIFVFGIALNLTPCVLPMMPINLAIIGAGAIGGSRAKGALRGGAYGLGIALSYGLLALIPVLTGAAFGTLQATWWFNAAIAIIFVLLALALLDVFMIDFTRFSSGSNGKQGTFAAFVAGVISALLAGACVAPILIAVLLLTTDYVAEGAYWALCLPFILGLGMAAPWPLAGAGLSCLPKPGAWMLWTKKVFAIIVLLFAGYYGWTAVKTCLPYQGLSGTDLPKIEAAIDAAHAEGKPVLLDFWGPACKACDKMEATTLQDPAILEALTHYEVLRVRMDLADRAIHPTQERFAIQGLPTFIIVE